MQDQATRLRQLVGDKTEYKTLVTEDNSASLRAGAKVLAVTSGKGGVGKTNITVNLAIALKRAGKKVLVIDADLGMANVDVVLGSRSHKHLLNLLEDGVELNNVLINWPYIVKYISGGSGIEKAIDFSMEQRQLLMQKLAACGSQADIILLDTGAGLGKNVMDFVLAADEVLLITTPEPTALTDAYAMMKAYSMYAKEKNLRLIINRVYDEQESKDVAAKLKQTAERFLQMPIDCLGYVYEDSAVMRSVRQQTPFLVANANCTAAKCIEALAASLLYGREMTVKRGWKGFLQEIFHFPR